jgi:hypothetical protein
MPTNFGMRNFSLAAGTLTAAAGTALMTAALKAIAVADSSVQILIFSPRFAP